MYFEGFDFSEFWEDSDYAVKNYICDPPTDELIAEIENELGYKLPESYIWLMKQHNGGIPVNTCFPTGLPTSWAENHIAITGIMGIGRDKIYSVCGELGSQFMIDEWEYPAIGVAICDCPSAGHDMIFLDYRDCGPTGEPKVVHVDQECDYEITPLADCFEDFIRGLVSEEAYDEDEEEEGIVEPGTLMEKIDRWYALDRHQRIVDGILSLPEAQRTVELLGQLAVAYNNLDEYDEAVKVLESIRASEENQPKFHYRLGYAHYYAAQEAEGAEKKELLGKARAAFSRALMLNPAEETEEDCREFLGWIAKECGETEAKMPSALAQAIMRYMDCPCRYFPPMEDDDPIVLAYWEAVKRGQKEGFVPMLVTADETLWECLIMNSDEDSDGEEDYAFDPGQVTQYRREMLTSPMKDGKAVLAGLIGERKEEALDDNMDWDDEILGELSGGEDVNRFISYWEYNMDRTVPLILAEIPVKHPWEVFAYLPFGGWNECPDTPDLMAVVKYWFETHGALPSVMTHDTLEFTVAKPVNKEDALQLALEQYAWCPDVVDQGPEDATVGTLADTLAISKVWYFWWD